MFTYDITTDRGKVRLLIPDRTAAQYLFEDDEIDYFLTAEGNVIKKAAALGLETMAADEAYVQKVIKSMDLSTNGAATAEALLKRAALLREQAAANIAGGPFDWAEMVVTDFNARECVYNEALRDS